VPLRKRRPNLPESFVKAVDQALSDDPGKRPSAMDAFREMLAMVGVASPSRWLGGLMVRLRRLVQT
jgi:hypothetical protein